MAVFHVAGKRTVSEDTGYMFKARCSWFCQLQYGEKMRPERHCCPSQLKITALQQSWSYLGFTVSEYDLKISKNVTVPLAAPTPATLSKGHYFDFS